MSNKNNVCACGNSKPEKAPACQECFSLAPTAARRAYQHSPSREMRAEAAKLIQDTAKRRATKT